MILAKDSSELQKPMFYGGIMTILISGGIQIYWLNMALQRFPATSVVPTYFVLFTLAAIMVGGVVRGGVFCI